MRKPARKYPMRSEVINFRIQPATKAALQKAAAAAGRTVSAEAEHQLGRALSHMGTGRTHAFFAMIAETIDGLAATRKAKWWNDTVAFDAAATVTLAAFELLRPPKKTALQSEPLSERSARFAVEATLRKVQEADLSTPFDKLKPYQRWVSLLKRDLGELADRPAIWGVSAEDAREFAEATRPYAAELQDLAKKADRTPEEEQRYAELTHRLSEASEAMIGRRKRK